MFSILDVRLKNILWNIFQAKFIVPDWGDIVDSGIGLSHRPGPPGYVGWQAGTTTHAGVNYIPQSGSMNVATDGRKCLIFLLNNNKDDSNSKIVSNVATSGTPAITRTPTRAGTQTTHRATLAGMLGLRSRRDSVALAINSPIRMPQMSYFHK
jgi:hypothetical protein